MKSRRCLVPPVGWYEWQGNKPPKQPYMFHRDGFRPFAFAGIWTAEKDGVDAFAILMREAFPELVRIHDRMPAILAKDDEAPWLAANSSGDEIERILAAPVHGVKRYAVSPLVNKPENNSAECIRSISTD